MCVGLIPTGCRGGGGVIGYRNPPAWRAVWIIGTLLLEMIV